MKTSPVGVILTEMRNFSPAVRTLACKDERIQESALARRSGAVFEGFNFAANFFVVSSLLEHVVLHK